MLSVGSLFLRIRGFFLGGFEPESARSLIALQVLTLADGSAQLTDEAGVAFQLFVAFHRGQDVLGARGDLFQASSVDLGTHADDEDLHLAVLPGIRSGLFCLLETAWCFIYDQDGEPFGSIRAGAALCGEGFLLELLENIHGVRLDVQLQGLMYFWFGAVRVQVEAVSLVAFVRHDGDLNFLGTDFEFAGDVSDEVVDREQVVLAGIAHVHSEGDVRTVTFSTS